MLETLAIFFETLRSVVLPHFAQVLVYPLNPAQRVYWLYLATSLLAALVAFRLHRRRGEAGTERGFLRFCFPREIWSHPSAWLDVRYFFVHQTLRIWMYTGLSVSITLATLSLLREGVGWLLPGVGGELAPASFADRALITVASMLLLDFVGFAAHALQHRIPLLWEFHRVHHSAPVLQPLSNYREHPVDNLFYTVVTGVGVGFVTTGAAFGLGCELATLDVLGVNAFLFVFNFAGYNLRHSHIWLAWPGFAGYLLGSPAYHQVHHSYEERHLNKNFAFLFPVWDWLFGSLYLPREPEPMRFGLGDGSEAEYDGVLKLYYLPFVRLFRTSRPGVEGRSEPASP